MSLILLEGLDRTGKSTVASYFESLGFEKIHMSAPTKGSTSDAYLQYIVDLVSSAATKDIVLDRTHYGELVWPQVYGRKAILNEDDIDVIREIEETVGVQRIWMTDNSIEAHWKRCVDNKEPLDKLQFTRARALFSTMAHKYGFEPITLPQFLEKFPDAKNFDNAETMQVQVTNDKSTIVGESPTIELTPLKYSGGKTAEQIKLEKANAINDILSKRILKSKGNVYDDLENDIRSFLNSKLGKLLGGTSNETSLTPEEIKFYKEMYKRAIDKGAK